jgi:hypothetical protein
MNRKTTHSMVLLLISILVLSFAPGLFAGKSIPPPGIGGINVGTKKQEAIDLSKNGPVFKDCESVLDSNALVIATKKGKVISYKDVNIESIKCMFNKKRSVQALSIVFPAHTVDDLENIYAFAQKILGPAKTTSAKKIGFMFEAEWKVGKYAATFFASDIDFEAFLLIAFAKFVKEEERRGTISP